MEMRHATVNAPERWLAHHPENDVVLFFDPSRLQTTARRFLAGFPGLVSYAVKANPLPAVIDNLAAAGITAFDVASPAEIDLLRARLPAAVLHYNNPVRAARETDHAIRRGVRSFAVDDGAELEKLVARLPAGAEIAVRFKLSAPSAAAYDFASKFGASPEAAVALLARVAAAGFTPSLTFHPGTQCTDPQAHARHLAAAADIARKAGVRLARINVGGGFPAPRGEERPPLAPIFAALREGLAVHFPDTPPALLCEPGRALVAEAFTAAVRVRALRSDGAVFLADGIYGLFAELPLVGSLAPARAVDASGRPRRAPGRSARLFGPTCDSVDEWPDPVPVPEDLAEGDWLLFENMGAYSLPTVTRFNGYGDHALVTLMPPA